MSHASTIQKILDQGIVSIIRAPNSDQLVEICEALIAGGIRVIEATFTTPNVLQTLQQVKSTLGDRIVLGAGTVLDPETARAAILAGCEYIVTPVVNVETIKLCRRYDVPCLSGAFTPTEILTAFEAGSEIVKLFPGEVGGPDYIKALRGPLPQIKLLPTGGVSLSTIDGFLKAGACAVGLGSNLVEKEALAQGDMGRITRNAAAYVAKIQEFRQNEKNRSAS